MRIQTMLRSLASGLAIYVAMAACSAAERTMSADPDASSASVGDALAGFLDEAGNPVGDALADTPDVSTEQCNKTGTFQGQPAWIAEHKYSGKSLGELALVRTLVPSTALDGYTHLEHGSAFVGDGKVAVYCGPKTGQPQFASVTFVLPR